MTMRGAEELCSAGAVRLAAMVRRREVSAREVLAAHLETIAAYNPQVNAICTLVPERAAAEALRADERQARGEELGPLHGLPIAIKDLEQTADIRTTLGSPIYRDFVPAEDSLMVARIRRAGAIVIGKTNVPEFGAGSQTFNPVFGATRNPWDLNRTCGGSSGGAAAALACGMVPIADGSDLGGSLRNPASFCGVIGMRPSPGRVPRVPADLPWDDLSVLGPMGRTVEDTALLLAAIAGPDPRAPLSLADPGESFAAVAPAALRGLRIAWSPDLGCYPVEREVVRVCAGALPAFRQLGAVVEEAAPDLTGADEIFQTLRAFLFTGRLANDYERHAGMMKDTVVWNVERGLRLSARDLARAWVERGQLCARVLEFFDRYQLLALPTVQVLAVDVGVPLPRAIEGRAMVTYLDWMATCYAITLTSCPAISVPCGLAAGGLPVGLQLVAPPRADRFLLAAAAAFLEAQPPPSVPISPRIGAATLPPAIA